MKKVFSILSICALLSTYSVHAQQGPGGGDPAAMMQRMKDRMKPQLIEKAKLTDAEADKVIEINFASRSAMRDMRNQNLTEDDRKKKMDEMQESINKKYKEIPLTDEKIKAVNEVYAEMRRNFQQRNNN
jgi:hypothetical protein